MMDDFGNDINWARSELPISGSINSGTQAVRFFMDSWADDERFQNVVSDRDFRVFGLIATDKE